MKNTLYEIITSLNSNQKVIIKYEDDKNAYELFSGTADEIPMTVFVDFKQYPELLRLETQNDVLVIAVY